MKLIANMTLYGLVGYFLSTAGVTALNWQYWAIFACMVGIQLLTPIMECFTSKND